MGFATIRAVASQSYGRRGHRNLRLASPAAAQTGAQCTSLRIAPDQWLIVSEILASEGMVTEFRNAIGELRAHVVDLSVAQSCVRLSGGSVRSLLAMGSGVNWSVSQLPPSRCVRTRFARLQAAIHCVEKACFELYFDRSYRGYLETWMQQAVGDPMIVAPA
jgi:heterotetrameric sarcosine oxidase gamma subunit